MIILLVLCLYSYSREFLKGFMDILRRQYGTRRVHCNVVYQEYIRDKDHYHMNATRVSNNNNNIIINYADIIARVICCYAKLNF